MNFPKRATNRSETFFCHKQLQARKHNMSSCKNLLLINCLVIPMSPAGQTWTFTSIRCQLSRIPVIILALCSAFQRLSGSCLSTALCFAVSTYHLVSEPHFHLPQGTLSSPAKHLWPSAPNQQPLTRIRMATSKSRKTGSMSRVIRVWSLLGSAPYGRWMKSDPLLLKSVLALLAIVFLWR